MPTTITPEVMGVLKRSTIKGNLLLLPAEQLERSLYEGVNKILTNAGGKWNRGQKGHVFPGDPSEKLGLAIETGKSTNEKQELQAFFTPEPLAGRLAELAAPMDGCTVLEPSSGHGALADACKAQGAKAVYCYEIFPEYAKVTEAKGYHTLVADFLTVNPDAVYDRVVMNPPFTKNQDIKHVAHALKFLAPGGILVAIMMPSTQRKAFQKLIEGRNAMIEEVPAGTFKESGTDIRTIILTIRN